MKKEVVVVVVEIIRACLWQCDRAFLHTFLFRHFHARILSQTVSEADNMINYFNHFNNHSNHNQNQ